MRKAVHEHSPPGGMRRVPEPGGVIAPGRAVLLGPDDEWPVSERHLSQASMALLLIGEPEPQQNEREPEPAVSIRVGDVLVINAPHDRIKTETQNMPEESEPLTCTAGYALHPYGRVLLTVLALKNGTTRFATSFLGGGAAGEYSARVRIIR